MPRNSRSTSVKVDFSGVEVKDFSIPDGDYVLTVTSVEKKRSESSGQDYLSWEFKVAEGPSKGKKVWHNTSLQPQSLWTLRQLLEAMGMEVEEGEMELELDDMAGESVGASIANEKYEGKDRPKIAQFIEVSDVEVEPKPTPTKAKATASTPKKDEEEETPPAKKTTKKKVSKPEFTVGQKVTFEDDGEEYTGKVSAVNNDVVTVKVGRDEWELDASEVTAV